MGKGKAVRIMVKNAGSVDMAMYMCKGMVVPCGARFQMRSPVKAG